MPIRSISDLRSAVGKDWDSVSDEDLIQSYADSVKMNPVEVALTLGYDPGSGGRESKRVQASISNYVGNLQGVGEELAGAVGLTGARDYLAEKRRANELQANVASARAREMGAIESYKEVEGFSSGANYALGLGIQSLPPLGEALVGGVAGRLAMGGTRAALAAAEASGDVAAAARAKKALNIGSNTGVVAAGYPSAVGDVLSSQREQTGGKTDAASAFALGVPYAALNVVGVEGALGRAQLFKNPLNLLDNVSGLKGGLARTAATGTTTAFKEGASETGQEFVNQAGRMAVDPTEQFFNEKSNERFKESFIGGATLGGLIGGGAGGWRRSESFIPNVNTSTNNQTGQQSTNDIQQAFQQTATGTTPTAIPVNRLAGQMGAATADPLTGRTSLVSQPASETGNPLAGRSSLIGQTAAPITSAAPVVTGGTTDIAQANAAANQQQQQQTQAEFAAQQQQKEAERAVFMADLVGLPTPETQRWDFFGKPIFGPAIQEAAAATAEQVGAMSGTQAQITRAINVANQQTGGKLVNVNFKPLKAADSVRKTFEKVAEAAARFQIAHVGSVEEAAQILEQLSQNTKGAQLEQLNAIHQALTGKDTTGYTASQQIKGATNGKQQQTTTGMGTVPIQSGTGEGSSGVAGNVQPSGIQSLITGSQPQGQTGQQTGQPSGEGIRTGTGVTPDLSGGQLASGQVNLTAPAPDTNQLLRQIFGDTYAIDETVPPATRGPATRGPATRATGQTGQVRVQPKQTGKPGISKPVSAGVAGERVVKRRYKWNPTNAPAAGTNQFYSTAVEHIHPTKRSEIILAVFANALEPRTTRGDEYSANIRAQILQMSLMEQMTAPEISKYFAELETPIDLKPGTIDTQRKRMGLVDSRSVRGVYFDTTSKQGQTLAADIVQAAAEFKTDAFPDGIGPDQLRGFYAAKNSFATGDEVVELSNDVIEEPTTRNTDVKLQEEMYRSSSEGNAAQSMGEISTAGGSQGNVDSLKKTRKDQKTKETFKDISALDQIEKLTDEADQIRDSLDGMAPKDPRRAALVDRLEQIGDVDSGEIQGLYKDYNKAQKLRSKEAEEAGVIKEQEVATKTEELTGEELAASEREDERKAEAAEKAAADKGETDAVQVESADEGNVRKPAGGGKAVGKGNAKPEKPAKQTKQAKTEVTPEEIKTPEEQWNELRTLAPELPAYADLNKDQRIRFDDLANRGKANLAAVVNQIVPAPQEVEQPKFSKGTAPTKPYTAKSLIDELKAFMRVDALGRNIIVVDDVAELEDLRDQAIGWSNDRAFGWTRGGKAILIASRIQEGQGRAKFMHEVGSHLGLDRMLAEKDIVALASQIGKWADLNNNSKESVLARKAIVRVGNAKTPDEDVMSELIAYFVEEAVLSGVDPSAAAKMTGVFGSWFRTLWAGFKNAVRKLGFKPESLTAQDVVNMAYGAARLEIAGTWHGTAADFRKFNHQYMGTGEGAQAYGWGSYLAQRYGIAEGYRTADIRRKGAKGFENTLSKFIGYTFGYDVVHPLDRTLEVYKGLEITKGNIGVVARKLHALGIDEVDLVSPDGVTTTVEAETPAGSMMRVDVNMEDNETLNWDEKISAMPQEVQDALAEIKDSLEAEGLLEEYLDKLNADWEELTGADLYKTILNKAHEDGAEIFFAIPGSDRMKANKASSLLLDSLGIKGIKFLDARSRDKDEKQIMFNGKRYSREDLINMKSDIGAPVPLDQITTLRHVLRHGVEKTIKEYQAKVDRTEKRLFTIRRETAERYKVPFNEAEELARAKQSAAKSYEGTQIAFLKTANVKVVGNKDITRNLVVFNDANIFRAATNIGADKEQVKFGISPAATVDETLNRLPSFVRTPTRSLVTNLLHQAKNGIYASAITEDVVKMASKYMKSANDYLNAQYARQGTRIQFEQRINKILSDFDKLSGEFKGTGANSVNKFIKDSTVSGKWGYYPGEHRVGTELFTVDPDMKLRFDAFDESAQNVIKAVFEHGYEALMLKKKAVEAAIDREFADREKAVMGDTEQLQELAKEKKLLLAREAKIRGIDVSSPYAYLGRYGDYVVVAKSAEFKHYEERAKLNDWDVKQAKQWLQDNISNADHYVVQFAETQAEADAIGDRLHATGNYDIMPEDAGVKEAEESYTGGGDIHLAVSRLRNLLQRQVSDGDISSANFQSMNKMVGDLYLMTVAEASARKSEIQRKNVAGADDNMMRNLATSGRADAHFLSTLEHNDAITDSMERMRNEAKNQRREAMPIYNELMKRQADSMEYKTPSTLAIALNRMNTLWSLTFSPAYYLQQTLQTAVISVPYLAGRLGYGNAVAQVNRGYKDIAGLVKGLGINDNIDFSKAPADVRDMLNKLVGMGKIDISMDANERATADEKGIFAKVMYKMQGVNNRIEAVNRSVAAIAAYRGYLARYGNNNTEAATQYAAQVVSDTHGSYDGFNTPRILAGNIGRVVGQFRRFQIIQLSMLARLMNNAFKGASADEKMVARKALGFITAQMAVVGGAMAVPFFNQIAWMMSKILGDPDEPDDFEFKLRRMIDNKVVADLLLRGVPASLGVDVSEKLGMGRVASILPFSQGDLTSRSGAEKVIVAALGPSASMTMKFADAFGMILKGDYYKGLEMALPNGFANVMKAARFSSEGITMRNGDLVLKPEDFGMVDAAFQAVGLPTNTVTNRQFTQNVKAEYDKFYAQKSADIKGAYVKAYRENDAKGMAEAREEFQRMEDSRASNGYKRQPMSDLFKAPMAAMKRERGVIGGVETSKQNKGFVELASQI